MEHTYKGMGKIVAAAWQDPAFLKHLKANPIAVKKQHGIDIAAGVQVEVIESQPNELVLVLPEIVEGELDDEHLAAVPGAGAQCLGSVGCPVSTASSNGSALCSPIDLS